MPIHAPIREGMPYDAFRKLRERAPVAWHPYKDGPGFLALTGYDEVLAVSHDSATWSSETDGVHYDVPGPDDLADIRGPHDVDDGPAAAHRTTSVGQ